MSEGAEEGSLQRLEEQVGQLTDLFRRRLLDDREKQRIFDSLYEELKAARALAEGEMVLPLARTVFSVIDRVDREDSALGASVAEELSEGLRIVGLNSFAPTGGRFDAATQEIHGEVDRGESGSFVVVRTARRGWTRAERVIRPALVVVAPAPVTSFDSIEVDGPSAEE